MTASALTPDQAVTELARVVPPGRTNLTAAEQAALAAATTRLLSTNSAAARAEFSRFQDTASRGIDVHTEGLRQLHAGATVLVTGGTGCIGSAVVRELISLGPLRVVSISRGLETRWPRFDGVEYLEVDIRDADAVAGLISTLQPDLVYHLAAQHDPGRAEFEVHRTLSTNVTGTANILAACAGRPGMRVACASTGKALRPFSRDVYSSSKKMTEWLLERAAVDTSITVSAVRFTHVVDNSIILRRLEEWSSTNSPIRLHSLETMFYIQSAREAAQLLMSAALDASPNTFTLAAIRDLGWPIGLMDLALGVVDSRGSASPLYLCGTEAGYEKAPYPALYDPIVSGGLSPLFNALEAFSVEESGTCTDLDVHRPVSSSAPEVTELIVGLCRSAASGAPAGDLRALIEQVGWSMWRHRVASTSPDIVRRHLALAQSKPTSGFSPDDLTVRSIVECAVLGLPERRIPGQRAPIGPHRPAGSYAFAAGPPVS
ncbi:NAD(P)-dependent dehydrogenase (short-subunit alcohol dehydrogenase family) [Nakamurella sp. UYEF19]|uniref:NAD-dependent epimerase/dehydratase family protein n=1 Tax=Nakamurella sp. UYEF19 TaxID=1756392 RepID=UPI00339201CE